MNKQRNKSKKGLTLAVTIVTLICLVIGGIAIVKNSIKVVNAGILLMNLNREVQAYNESSIKTDEMTDYYLECISDRQLLYNSPDNVVRIYSNLPSVIKFLIWLLACVSVVGIPALEIVAIYNIILFYKKATKTKTRKQNPYRDLARDGQ